MKKLSAFIALLFISFSAVLLSACASCPGNKYSMVGWPTLSIDPEIAKSDEVSIEFKLMPTEWNDEKYFYGTSFDERVINDIYQSLICYQYSEETVTEINTEQYWDNVNVKFWKGGEVTYALSFYSYGIYDGYFIFENGEIHKYHGDFVSGIYETYKDRLVQEEKN